MTAPIPATVTDKATGEPAVSIGVATSLLLKLVNATGADIQLVDGVTASTFSVYFPVPGMFTPARLQAMQVTTPGWKSTVIPAKKALAISCTTPATWVKDAPLVIEIGGVTSDGPPSASSVTIVPSAMKGNIPLSIPTPFAVKKAAVPGNLPLNTALLPTLDNQGSVYVSDKLDPLTNTLFLNLKNIGTGPLATGDKLYGNPQVVVSFVYGSTSGALAPDDTGDGKPPEGSAWNAKVGLGSAQTTWRTTDPNPIGATNPPTWTLQPTSTNLTILGPPGSDTANVSFEFTELLSYTPTGHTQMILVATGFAQDKTKAYDDFVYVLDIVKLDAPPTRGLVSFYSRAPVVDITDPKATEFEVPVHWTMFDVARADLYTTQTPIEAIAPKVYKPPAPLGHDETTLKLAPPSTSGPVFTTIQSFDGKGGFLNSMQFTAFARLWFVRDPTGRAYKVARWGSTFWMVENFTYDAERGGTWAYPGQPQPESGRLYDWDAARASIPAGWSLPTVDDWNALFTAAGGGKAAYAALIDGGTPGTFAAQLGGQRTVPPSEGNFRDGGGYGLYWTADGGAAQFSGTSRNVSITDHVDATTALSVRYIQHG